ncbi:MAG: radical SAM protein [Candidatus Omnitrophica bacterium]|nr:radical SAM protein [Candidatus Omnitrophota bacterium]
MHIVFVHTGQESLGLEYLSAVLKIHGHKVSLVYEPLIFRSFRFYFPSLDRHPPQTIAQRALAAEPDLICFSIESDYFGWACQVVRELKQLKDIPILLGGIHPTSVPENVISETSVDYICLGEGEDALVELVASLERKDGRMDILNIWYCRQDRIIRNPLRPLNENLDDFPFPDKELFYREYPGFINDVYTIITGRGCCNACSYCYNSMLQKRYEGRGRYLRRRSVENVIAELKHAHRVYHFKRVTFCDDVFTTDLSWLESFVSLYKKEIGLPFYCQVHPSFVDKTRIQLLADGGCTVVNYGIQTIDENLRKRYLHRQGSNREIVQHLNDFYETKIFLFTNFIVGLPRQDEEELIRIVEFCCSHPAGFHDVNWLRYYPGTDIVSIAQREGLLTEQDVERINASRDYQPYAHGGHARTKQRSQLRNLIFLTHILPKGLIRWLLERQRYRFLPTFNMRNMIVIPRLLFMKWVKGRKYPYPNLSLFGNLKYYWHCLVSRVRKKNTRKKFHRLTGFKALVRRFMNMFYLYKMLNRKVWVQSCRYFIFRFILRKKIPGTAILASTFHCQLDCECCSAGIFRRYYQGVEEMSLKETEDKIREIAKIGIPRLHLAGGEPLLRKDIVDIVKVSSDCGLIVFLETNGLLLTEEMILRLKSSGISSVNVSLDSADAFKHNRLRTRAGVFEHVCQVITLCVKHKVNCIVSTYATKENIYNGDLNALIQLSKRMKCYGIRVIAPQPAGNWILCDDVILSREDNAAVEAMMPIFFMALNRTKLIRCPLRTAYKLFILPDGQIAPCEHLPYIFKDSNGMSLERLPELINRFDMFSKNYYCLPRDRDFRQRYYKKGVSRDMSPIFLDADVQND